MDQQSFSKAMIAGCEAAVDAGMFYQDDFEDYVVKHMGGYDCEAVLCETVSVQWYGEGNFLAEHRAWEKEAEQRLKSLPRGHYIQIEKRFDFPAPKIRHLPVGGSHDFYDVPQNGEKVCSRMIGYEIYLCRKMIENSRIRDNHRKSLEAHRYCVGQVFRNYRHPGEIKPFSKATIIGIYPESGQVRMQLTKRGTSKVWEVTVGAGSIEERIEVTAKPPASDTASQSAGHDLLGFALAG